MGDLTASHEVTIKFHLQMLPPFSDLIKVYLIKVYLEFKTRQSSAKSLTLEDTSSLMLLMYTRNISGHNTVP